MLINARIKCLTGNVSLDPQHTKFLHSNYRQISLYSQTRKVYCSTDKLLHAHISPGHFVQSKKIKEKKKHSQSNVHITNRKI